VLVIVLDFSAVYDDDSEHDCKVGRGFDPTPENENDAEHDYFV
jgi:hypothetical protein